MRASAAMAAAVAGLALSWPAGAADPAGAAERKAEVLEEKASPEGGGARVRRGERITAPEAQAVDPQGAAPLDDALTCLARAIYWESKGEDGEGMRAVASVVMNRLANAEFPDTVCEVVKQGGEAGSCQFSWWCDGHPDVVEETAQYAEARETARRALNRQLRDPTGGALYFHHRRLSPVWAKKMERTARIGEHVFYRPTPSKRE